ncbi:MAG: heat-inducible transcription repressor HrcA [Ruminococcus sp.]|nr:heat-inducible transcription repressor HrcA [Ruminococcus sp.]NLT07981.1 heat-inducible transcription repressor HrcA [Ruminococcus sp.]HRR76996.1 heat-inducible transcriptional repressor HrcA [Ruminococcus sp.]
MDDRKLKILAAIVDEYVRTGEPVGSKAISKLEHINVSAATIRNDMAALEQMGYLEQPHTSAGRVPTFMGYRLYIDELMTPPELSDEEKQRLDEMLGTEDTPEELLIQNAAAALTELTHCAAVVTNPAPRFSVISKVEVIPTGKRLYVILLITSSGSIKNKACRLEFDLSHEQLEFFTHYIEENLNGISVEDLSEEMFDKMVAAVSAYMISLSPLVKGISELSEDLRQQELTVKGGEKLLSCDELDKMEVVRFIEHKDGLSNLLEDAFSGIQVKFGSENNSFAIGNSSLIVSKYRKGGKEAGSLGVIGPMRVDYKKIIPYVDYLTQKISYLMSGDSDDIINGGAADTSGKP